MNDNELAYSIDDPTCITLVFCCCVLGGVGSCCFCNHSKIISIIRDKGMNKNMWYAKMSQTKRWWWEMIVSLSFSLSFSLSLCVSLSLSFSSLSPPLSLSLCLSLCLSANVVPPFACMPAPFLLWDKWL